MKIGHATTAAFALLLALASTPSRADQLDTIKASGKLTCGIFATSEPFGFQDTKTREVVGYDADICRVLAKSLGVEAVLKPISIEARIPELVQGRIDVLTAVLGYTAERAKQIDFSYTYFASIQKVMVAESSGITSLDGLKGKKISANKGSTSEAAARRAIPDAETVTFNDGAASFLALQQGKVSGYASAELVIVKLLDADTGTKYRILDKIINTEPWGVGVRKGEPALLNHINKVLKDMDTSGEAETLFNRWFGKDTVYKMKKEFTVGPVGG
jgi:polar amino acid transport system substrate-binding protein